MVQIWMRKKEENKSKAIIYFFEEGYGETFIYFSAITKNLINISHVKTCIQKCANSEWFLSVYKHVPHDQIFNSLISLQRKIFCRL